MVERNKRLHRSGYTRTEDLAIAIIGEVRGKLATLRRIQESEAHIGIQESWGLPSDIFS